jgi:hypothetical protein
MGWHTPQQDGSSHMNLQCTVRGAVFTFAIALSVSAHAQDRQDSEDLAKAAQNPVSSLISVPFQENANLNVGPYDHMQNVLNIQPVIPIHLNEDWNLITRTILPIISQPGFAPNQGRTNGIGDTQVSLLFSPAKPGNWIWGAGAIIQLPTHTNTVLGNNNAGYGPAFVILHLERGSPWVYGVLINDVFSSDSATSPAYNNGTIQPFLNYNLKSGMYFTSSPLMTVNWNAKGSDQWTVPMGGGVGKIFRFGKLPVNMQVAAYYNVASPQFGGNWQLRAQAQFMFPK